MKTQTKLLLAFLVLLAPSVFAQKGGYLRINPIIGLERVQKISPVAKTKTRTIVGTRVLYGPPAFSLEGELTRSEDSETVFDPNIIKETEESYAARVGLRSGFNLGFLGWYLRAGGQARRSKITREVDGVTTTRTPAVNIAPYAGTGFNLNFQGNFFANGGITVIFTGKPKGSDRDYQTTFGFGVRI
jgi:hypothetical protein